MQIDCRDCAAKNCRQAVAFLRCVAQVSLPQSLILGVSRFKKGFAGYVVQYQYSVKGSFKFYDKSFSNATHRWATRTADRVLFDCFKAVKAVGGIELPEEGGGEGGLDNQHVPRHDLLLGHHVSTLRFRAFHLRQNSM